MGIEWKRNVILWVALVLATLFIYSQIGTHDFIGYDDDNYVTQNPYVTQGLNKESIFWAFTTTHVSNWHPITWLSHMLDVELHGINPGAHHLTNLLFHILNSLLLFVLFTRMTGHVWQSVVVAFLFAIHPLHIESVAWIAERKDVVSTFFGLLTIWSYSRYVHDSRSVDYLLMVAFFILALMAKPMVVTLPFVLLLLDYWPLRRMQVGQDLPNGPSMMLTARQLVYEKIPLFVLVGASCVVTILLQQRVMGTLEVYPLTTRIANAMISYVKYIGKMFWPQNLGILYPYPKIIPDWQVFGAFAVLAGITFLAVRYCKRLPWLFVGWFWYLGTLFPVIGLVQAGVQAMADRYTYVPLIGLFVIMSWGTVELFRAWRYKKVLLSVIAAGTFLALGIVSWMQVARWHDSISLFEHTLRVTEDNYVIHNNLGFELALKNQKEKALKHYEEALRINPDFEQAQVNYGSLLFSLGRKAESLAFYQEVLRAKPGFANVHYSFAIMLFRIGNFEAAVPHFIEALRMQPDFAEAYNGLGAVMASQGKVPEAIEFFKKALAIDPYLAAAKINIENLSQHGQKETK